MSAALCGACSPELQSSNLSSDHGKTFMSSSPTPRWPKRRMTSAQLLAKHFLIKALTSAAPHAFAPPSPANSWKANLHQPSSSTVESSWRAQNSLSTWVIASPNHRLSRRHHEARPCMPEPDLGHVTMGCARCGPRSSSPRTVGIVSLREFSSP